MPELQWPWAYFAVWGIFIALAAALLIYFKKHGWFD
jgi:Mg2+ and Co2+ transporter CorA